MTTETDNQLQANALAKRTQRQLRAAPLALLVFFSSSACLLACGNNSGGSEDENSDAGEIVLPDAGPAPEGDASANEPDAGKKLCPDDPYKASEDNCPCGTTEVVQGCAQNIDTAAGFLALREQWNGASESERGEMPSVYILKKDINLGDELATTGTHNAQTGLWEAAWTGIGTREAPFNGTFLGDGHAITASMTPPNGGEEARLTLVCEDEAMDCGLFGVIAAGGSAEGFTFDADMAFRRENSMMEEPVTAGLAAGLVQNASVKGVTARGKLSMAALNGAAGGLVGYCDGCTIAPRSHYVISHSDSDKPSADVEIFAENALAGGLAGWVLGDAALTDVTSRGDVSAAAAGGLIGRMDGGSVRRADALGSVMSDQGTALTGGNGAAGGLVAWMETGLIDSAAAHGGVIASADAQMGTALAGGFVGKMVLGQILNAMALGEVAAFEAYYQYAGGFAGEVQAGRIQNAMARGRVTTSGAYFAYAGGLAGSLSVLAEDTSSVGGILANVYAAGSVEGELRPGSISFVGSNAHLGALLGQYFVSPFDGPAGTVSMAYWNSAALEGGAPLDDEDNIQYMTHSAPIAWNAGANDFVIQETNGEAGSNAALTTQLNFNIPLLGNPPADSRWISWKAADASDNLGISGPILEKSNRAVHQPSD